MPVEHKIRQRWWVWINHTLCKLVDSITQQARGEKEKRTAENTWRRDLDDTDADNWIYSLRTRLPGGIMLAAYALEGAMKALIDWYHVTYNFMAQCHNIKKIQTEALGHGDKQNAQSKRRVF